MAGKAKMTKAQLEALQTQFQAFLANAGATDVAEAEAPATTVTQSKAAAKAPPLCNVPAVVMAKIKAFTDALDAAYAISSAKFVEVLMGNANRGLNQIEVLELVKKHAPGVAMKSWTEKGPWIFVKANQAPKGSEVRNFLTWLGFEKTGRAGARLVHKVGRLGGRMPHGARGCSLDSVLSDA